MASLKRTPKQSGSILSAPEEDFFPHSLFLDAEDIEKLGLSAAEIGSEHTFTFKGKISSVSQSEREGEENRKDMTFQLTDTVDGSEKKPSLAERIFTSHGDNQ